jgi:hypothetical protein
VPLDTETPLSPGWWLVRLTRRLNAQRARTHHLERLYKGDHDLPSVPDKYRTVFRMFQAQARTNYLALVAEAPLERMSVEGFRVGDSEGTDATTWDRWQRANMDADQVVVHRSMLALSLGFTMVSPHPRKPDVIAITPEFPDQMIVEPYPEDRRDVRMALKMWEDDITGEVRANLISTAGELGAPDGYVIKFRGPRSTRRELLVSQDVTHLLPILGEWEMMDYARTGMSRNPVTSFENRPGVDFRPRSEFEDVIPIQDRINSTLFHRLVAEAFGSFRQKAILNYVYDEDPDGNAIPPDLKNDLASAWIFEKDEEGGSGVSLFEFSQTDTSNIISAAEADVRDLAAITRTPPHYLLTGMNNIGGDALKTAETGLVSKVKREHIPQATGSWKSTMSKAAELAGDDPTELDDSEVLWADAESRTMAELYDAAVKAQTAGVPWRQRMELLGFAPKEIDRMDAQRTADAMVASLSAPPPPIAIGAQPGSTPGGQQTSSGPAQGSNINSAQNGAQGA